MYQGMDTTWFSQKHLLNSVKVDMTDEMDEYVNAALQVPLHFMAPFCVRKNSSTPIETPEQFVGHYLSIY